MHKIINDAQNSQESKISSTIKINKNTSEWKQDDKDKNYLSKTYSVSSGATIQNYRIKISRENNKDLGGIKLTDENNIEKNEFTPGQRFKVLIPIKNATEKSKFDLNVEAKINTKPILYGVAPNSSYQDYALTCATYEDGNGNISDEYEKNETKIIIIKEDEDTDKRLEGVEFELLDENKNVVISNLKTNNEGKVVIENLIPGKYFLKETNTIDGYQKYDELIEIDIDLNEETTVIVNNKKEEKPKIEKTKKQAIIKKLPVTGM